MAGVSFTPKSAKRIADVVRLVEGEPRDNVGDPNKRSVRAGRQFWAKLTGNGTLPDGRNKYAWQSVLTDKDGFKDYGDTTDTRSGDLTAGDDGIERYAIDVTEWKVDSVGEALANDRVVLMLLDYYKSDDGKILPRYTFSSGGGGSLPTAQYKDQVYKMVSQKQSGWSFLTAHAMG